MKKALNVISTILMGMMYMSGVIQVNAESSDFPDNNTQITYEEENVFCSNFQNRMYQMNEIDLYDNVINREIQYFENYVTVKSTAYEQINDFVNAYTTNVMYATYDPIGGTFVQGLYNAQFIVYVNNAYSSGLTYRKPIYYTQHITSFDNGAGNPASLQSNAHFVGTWGTVGDVRYYGRKDITSLTTYGTSTGTRSTGISEYFLVSLTNTCFFDLNVTWNVKGGSQINLINTFSLW